MGHTSSNPTAINRPFLVDLASTKGAERIAVVALNEGNVASVDCPLFVKFYQARCEDPVHHWYKASHDRSTLPPHPSPESVYDEFVLRNNDTSTAKYMTAVPLVFLRLNGSLVRGNSKPAPTLLEILSGDSFDVVGYVGCRSRQGHPFRLEIFLTKVFQNEAKSMSLFQMACKCYVKHLSDTTAVPTVKSGNSAAMHWPASMTLQVLDTNLPSLRLIQKVFGALAPDLQDRVRAAIKVHSEGPADKRTIEFRLDYQEDLVMQIAHDLASDVKIQGHRFVLPTKAVEVKLTTTFTVLDLAVMYAKNKWKESNLVVAQSNTPQTIVPSRKEVRHNGSANPLQQVRPADPTSPPPTTPGTTTSGNSTSTGDGCPLEEFGSNTEAFFAMHEARRGRYQQSGSADSSADIADISMSASSDSFQMNRGQDGSEGRQSPASSTSTSPHDPHHRDRRSRVSTSASAPQEPQVALQLAAGSSVTFRSANDESQQWRTAPWGSEHRLVVPKATIVNGMLQCTLASPPSHQAPSSLSSDGANSSSTSHTPTSSEVIRVLPRDQAEYYRRHGYYYHAEEVPLSDTFFYVDPAHAFFWDPVRREYVSYAELTSVSSESQSQ